MKEDKIKNLTKIQFDVTQNCGTETPDNEFWNHKEDGLYVDIISVFFCSIHKYDSGSGTFFLIN